MPAIATASLLLASGALAQATSHAEQAILIPGAMPFKNINPLYPSVAQTYPDIGVHFLSDGASRQLIDYSQDPLASNSALAEGVTKTVDAVDGTEGPVVIVGESMGSMVAWRAAAELARTDPQRDITVVLIASPDAGISEYFKEGTYIPILNYRVSRIQTTDFETTVVIGEYDGWSDPPDRPWNLIASANAVAGIAYVHGPPSFTADPDDVPPENITVNGKVTTYLLPTENLPLTQVFRDVGVPDALVDKADDVLRPVVDAGYVRHDEPGDTRPYLYDGEIHRNVQSQQQAREPSPAAVNADLEAPRREHRGEARQVVGSARAAVGGLAEKVKAGVDRLTKRLVGVRPAPEPET
jgi:diacyltrehalose acyltransferase